MYQIEWFDDVAYKKIEHTTDTHSLKSQLVTSDIEYILQTHWEEHCLECAPPACYASCPLYIEREDKKCRNLYYGVRRNRNFSGLYGYGAEIKFKKWGKLETEVNMRYGTVDEILLQEHKNENNVSLINALYGPLALVDKKRKLNGAYTLQKRKKLRQRIAGQQDVIFDEFVIECWSYESAPFRLIIENKLANQFRTSVVVNPGANLIKIPFTEFKYVDGLPTGTLSVLPENDLEAHIVFTWLDFVKYKKSVAKPVSADAPKPAAKIKCVAWDLDNTMWAGVFIESKPEDLVVNNDAIALIKKLDEMGIIQTVVSKNNHDEVMPFLKSIGIDEYFLYPGINWGQKSENLKRIAKNLNINIDTFAVIDDSPFERMEIATALPQVRVYEHTRINELLSLPEFNTPITEEGRNRRKFYQVEQMRNEVVESFSGNYSSFLKSCDFHLNIFVPRTPEQVDRCYELIQRTNQLNISSKRYTREEYDAILKDDSCLKYAFDCRDKFGEYGIVGFCIIRKGDDNYKITDFVISCRVAQKMVEHSFIYWLSRKMKDAGISTILADYIKTGRNAPILAVFEDLEFGKQDQGNEYFVLTKDIDKLKAQEEIITVYEVQ